MIQIIIKDNSIVINKVSFPKNALVYKVIGDNISIYDTDGKNILFTSPWQEFFNENGSLYTSKQALIDELDSSYYNAVGGGGTGTNSGGFTSKISFAPTTSATAYTANDNIGGIITLTNLLRTSGGTGILDSVSIWLLNNAAPNLYIDFWNAAPSGTYTNDAAQVIAGDQLKWLGMIEISETDWKQTGVVSRVTANPPKFGIKGNASADIYMTIQDKTGVTLGSTAGLFGTVTLLQD